MNGIEAVSLALDGLGFKHRHEATADSIEYFEIVIDEGEEIAVSGLLYDNEDGSFFRLLAYIDELSEDKPLEQLSVLMALNGEVPYGAYCMDPLEQVIYFTINMPVDEALPKVLAFLIDFLLVSQDVYDQEYPSEDDAEIPQG